MCEQCDKEYGNAKTWGEAYSHLATRWTKDEEVKAPAHVKQRITTLLSELSMAAELARIKVLPLDKEVPVWDIPEVTSYGEKIGSIRAMLCFAWISHESVSESHLFRATMRVVDRGMSEMGLDQPSVLMRENVLEALLNQVVAKAAVPE